MTTSPYVKTNFTVTDPATYKTQIDGNSVVVNRIAAAFNPHAQTVPNMTVLVDAGNVFDGVILTEVAAQSTGVITAPVGNPRIDRVVIDIRTGVVSVVTGTPAASPAAPAITAGKEPICQVLLQTTSTSITDSMITDERNLIASYAGFGPETSIASAATVDLGTASSHNVLITGTTTITAFGSSASTNASIYIVEFAGALTLTHNATSLVLPTGANILTQAEDSAIFEYTGSGNWKCHSYFRANGNPITLSTEATIASATTTDLGTAGSNIIAISGTTTITSLGSTAVVANPLYFVRFTGALVLTHNGTSLILPGAANITTAAGDSAEFLYLGSGNWLCRAYNKTNGMPSGYTVGTAANNLVQLNGSAQLPAVSGALLTNVAGIPVVTSGAAGKIVFGAVTYQWGSGTGSSVTFGTAFSSTPWAIHVTNNVSTAENTSTFSWTSSGFSRAGTLGFSWTAIGPT